MKAGIAWGGVGEACGLRQRSQDPAATGRLMLLKRKELLHLCLVEHSASSACSLSQVSLPGSQWVGRGWGAQVLKVAEPPRLLVSPERGLFLL